MNATAELLDQFLRNADPIVARRVEDGVQRLLQVHAIDSTSPHTYSGSPVYQFPSRSLGVRSGIDLAKLAHFEDDQ